MYISDLGQRRSNGLSLWPWSSAHLSSYFLHPPFPPLRAYDRTVSILRPSTTTFTFARCGGESGSPRSLAGRAFAVPRGWRSRTAESLAGDIQFRREERYRTSSERSRFPRATCDMFLTGRSWLWERWILEEWVIVITITENVIYILRSGREEPSRDAIKSLT